MARAQGVYPPRLSIAELRDELEAYTVWRLDEGLGTDDAHQERMTVEYFLHWLEENMAIIRALTQLPTASAIRALTQLPTASEASHKEAPRS